MRLGDRIIMMIFSGFDTALHAHLSRQICCEFTNPCRCPWRNHSFSCLCITVVMWIMHAARGLLVRSSRTFLLFCEPSSLALPLKWQLKSEWKCVRCAFFLIVCIFTFHLVFCFFFFSCSIDDAVLINCGKLLQDTERRMKTRKSNNNCNVMIAYTVIWIIYRNWCRKMSKWFGEYLTANNWRLPFFGKVVTFLSTAIITQMLNFEITTRIMNYFLYHFFSLHLIFKTWVFHRFIYDNIFWMCVQWHGECVCFS